MQQVQGSERVRSQWVVTQIQAKLRPCPDLLCKTQACEFLDLSCPFSIASLGHPDMLLRTEAATIKVFSSSRLSGPRHVAGNAFIDLLLVAQ